MVKSVDEIFAKIGALPPELKREVVDYIEFLSKKYSGRREQAKPRFDWEGGLSDLKGRYTSVELQHKSMKWR